MNRTHFNAVGYVRVPAMIADCAEAVAAAFDEVFEQPTPRKGGLGRLGVSSIATRHPLLRQLQIERIAPFVQATADATARYVGGDGTIYGEDTYWHRDGRHQAVRIVKAVTYLESLSHSSGALRFIPGSHAKSADWDRYIRLLKDPDKCLGLPAHELPCAIMPTEVGDIIVFDTHILHASFGGSARRRQITWTFACEFNSPAGRMELQQYLLADRSVV